MLYVQRPFDIRKAPRRAKTREKMQIFIHLGFKSSGSFHNKIAQMIHT